MNGSSKEESRRRPFPRPFVHLAESSRFRGWLPTVSGRLSFTVFGHTLFPTRAITANPADPSFRCVTTYQRIYAGDTPWGLRWLVRALAGYRANFIFVFVG